MTRRKQKPGSIWDYPLYYDIALSYRDYRSDVLQMLKWNRRFGIKNPKRILEAACGPANHLFEFARHCEARMIGIDYSQNMVDYAKAKARRFDGVFDIRRGDMRTFMMRSKVDFAYCPLLSMNYLLTVAEVKEHLSAMAFNLRRGGLYIVELIHPHDILEIDASGIPWKSVRDGVTVSTQWATEEDTFDAVNQISQTHVVYTVNDTVSKRRFTISTVMRDRMLWRDELALLIQSVGKWETVGFYGSLHEDIPLNHARAEQMVCILKKA